MFFEKGKFGLNFTDSTTNMLTDFLKAVDDNSQYTREIMANLFVELKSIEERVSKIEETLNNK